MAANEYWIILHSLIEEVKGLKKAQNSFNKNIERQLDVHESLLVVHRQLIGITQRMSEYVVESKDFIIKSNEMIGDLKDLINGIVEMSMEVKHTYQMLNIEDLCKAKNCPHQIAAKQVSTDEQRNNKTNESI